MDLLKSVVRAIYELELCMHQDDAVIVLSGIPIQYIVQCLSELCKGLFACCLIWHCSTSPDQRNLHLSRVSFTPHNESGHSSRKEILLSLPYLFQSLHQFSLMTSPYSHYNRV